MNKCHSNINWVNNTSPAINDTNLNYMDGCIDTLDDRVVVLDSDKVSKGGFQDSSRIAFSLSGAYVTADIKPGSIGDTQMENQYLSNCQAAQSVCQGLADALLDSVGLKVVGTQLVFSPSFADYYNITVVGTQLQISLNA